MGLFDKLFSGSNGANQEDDLPWIDLNSVDQLDAIVEQSKTKPQLIFKHSTRCGISRMVISQFKKEYQLLENEADLYYLDLLNYRDISNGIAERFQVMHQSPQLLVIKNGGVVAHESHGGINSLDLGKFVSI